MADHDPGRYHRLRVFISSTGDLEAERATVADALSALDIDGIRFEAWPSAPSPPIVEALQRLAECDAVILLLGRRYGNRTESGISVTHLEYRRATDLQKPIFVYLLKARDREPEQDLFVEEVRQEFFHCPPVRSLEELREQVRRSLIDEFTRCFRQVHSMLPKHLAPARRDASISTVLSLAVATLPAKYPDALSLLQSLYEVQDDTAIHALAGQVEATFPDKPDMLNFVYMAEVNLAMDHRTADLRRIREAVGFWNAPSIRERYRGYALDYCLGNALSALGRLPEAIERYRAALQSKPTFAQAWKNLGTAHIEQGNYQEGKACIEEALRLDPQLFEGLYSLGTFLLQTENDAEAALGYFNRIISASVPRLRLGGVYGWRAIAQARLGRLAEGISSAEDAIEIAPDTHWAWQVAGRLYALARRQDKSWLGPAARFWERFLVRFPLAGEAWAESGWVHWALWQENNLEKHGSRSLAAFTKATEFGLVDDGLLWDRLGHLHQAVGDLPAAEAAYRRAYERDPSRFGYCLGVCLISLERYQEALPLVQTAAATHQPDARSWFQVGFCQEKLGNIIAAVEAYERAIALDLDYPHPRFNLGGIYWNRRDIPEALEIWQEAMARFPDHPLVLQVRRLLENVE